MGARTHGHFPGWRVWLGLSAAKGIPVSPLYVFLGSVSLSCLSQRVLSVRKAVTRAGAAAIGLPLAMIPVAWLRMVEWMSISNNPCFFSHHHQLLHFFWIPWAEDE